jgi:hypothetical protein
MLDELQQRLKGLKRGVNNNLAEKNTHKAQSDLEKHLSRIRKANVDSKEDSDDEGWAQAQFSTSLRWQGNASCITCARCMLRIKNIDTSCKVCNLPICKYRQWYSKGF